MVDSYARQHLDDETTGWPDPPDAHGVTPSPVGQAPLAQPRFFNKPIQTDPLFWISCFYALFSLYPAAFAGVFGDLAVNLVTAALSAVMNVVLPMALFAVLATVRYLFRRLTRKRRLARRSPTTGESAMWLADPMTPRQQRYWDGHQWTDYVAPTSKRRARSWGWLALLAIAAISFVLALFSPLSAVEAIQSESTSDQAGPRANASLLAAIDDVVAALNSYGASGTDDTDPYAVRESIIRDSALTRELDRANAVLAAELGRADLPSRADRGLDLRSTSDFVNGVSHWVQLDLAYAAGASACSPQWDAYSLQNCLADNHAQFEAQLVSVWTEMQTAGNECISRRNDTLSSS